MKIILLTSLLILGGCHRIAEMPYTLSDGTPCTIILKGSKGGKVMGISCNYGKQERNCLKNHVD
jgi:hypothetical protein